MVECSEPHEVWLGVGLRVEAASPEEATRQAVAWLRAILETAPAQDGLHVTVPAADLVEPVVRGGSDGRMDRIAFGALQTAQQHGVSVLVSTFLSGVGPGQVGNFST
jgi:hypothetical protein